MARHAKSRNNQKYSTYNIQKKRNRLPDVKRLEKDVLQYIIGQDCQVRQMITSIYRAINFKSIKANVLIIGSSGTGKTATVTQIAKRLHIPYTIEDATKYTQEGYYGSDVSEMICNLILNANNDIEKAQKGMIIIDEIDKKSGNNDDHDVAGVEVLNSLLKIIEGTTVKVNIQDQDDDYEEVDFETKNLIIIFMGAFSGLDKIRNKRLNRKKLGFISKDDCGNEDVEQAKFLKQDLVKYGMPEEFVGRIDTIIEMNKLTKNDLALILKKSKLSIFRRYQQELRDMGITLSYKGELFNLIAEASLELDTGARELSNTVNHMFENILYDIFSNPGKYTKCTLYLDIVKDNTKYELS
jgi:ATP-dependent Clp protease ATP-binding subunit ClpX